MDLIFFVPINNNEGLGLESEEEFLSMHIAEQNSANSVGLAY